MHACTLCLWDMNTRAFRKHLPYNIILYHVTVVLFVYCIHYMSGFVVLPVEANDDAHW